MRDIAEVIDQMLVVIPADKESLRARLDSVKKSAFFTAPELAGNNWHSVAGILEGEIGEPLEPWQKEVAAIFNGPQEATDANR